MKHKKLFKLFSPLITLLVILCTFHIPYTIAGFVDKYTVDSDDQSFIDSTTENFVCYPLEKENQNDPNICAISWAKTPEECIGTLTIPETVTKVNGGETISYTVKAIAQSGFRYCEFSSIVFASDNVEEIKSEAFYCCQNLTTFTMPEKCINGIAPSAFMDCRNLTKVDMSNTITYINSLVETGHNTFLANNPYIIGDHAFASCVKLKGFTFPTTLTEIGEGAFNNCIGIFGLFFPANNGVNTISIGKYAFADCSNLTVVHFETNFSYIDSYAFSQCNKLKIYYQGNINNPNDPINSFDEYFRKKHVATNQTNLINDYVPIAYDISAMQMDEDHPGLIYTIQPGPIYYDGASAGTSSVVLDNSTDDYITIFQWKTPHDVETDDYDDTTDILTIPNTIAGLPVKRIATQAFVDREGENDPLRGVIFNQNLVQICQEAFKNSNQLATIDFSNCGALREIGHSAFEPSNQNDSFSGTLSFPNTLYYIGNKAFYKFRKATGLQLFDQLETPHLKMIGNSAFEYLGSQVAAANKGTLDLVLPYSLQDGYVSEAKPVGITDSRASIGANCFANSPLIKYVTMQFHPTDPETGIKAVVNKEVNPLNNRTGFGKKAFSSCSYLLRFKGNKAMMRLGEAIFEKCSKLKEIFLSTYLASNEEDLYVWGYGEGLSIFYEGNDSGNNATEFRDTIIYVDGGDAPKRRAKQQRYYVWNTDPKTYQNEYATSLETNLYGPFRNNGSDNSTFLKDSVIGRRIVPTYYNVKYYNSGNMKYLNLSTGSVSEQPTSDYSNCVAFIKSSNKYIVTKCYAQGLSTIDMTTWNLGADIVQIGACAFSTLSTGNTTQKIILSNKITSIRSRAFYSVGTDGINIVTYKNNGVEVTDPNATNVCFLPSTVTRVEEFSFYNNDFEKVTLPTNLAMLGNTAFTVSPGKQASITTFGGTGSSSNYTYSGQGMIDTSSKTLLYYAANGTGTLDLSNEDLYAVGARALANTKYSSIALPTTVTTIYGGAFERNTSLTEVSGLDGLKYIAATVSAGDTDVYNNDANFNVQEQVAKDFAKDYEFSAVQSSGNGHFRGNYAIKPYLYNFIDSYGAFAYCNNLTTVNLTSCQATLKKIGYGAFESCSNLVSMTGGSTVYTYFRYGDYTGLDKDNVVTMTSQPNAPKETKTTGVCDLSEALNLKTIGRVAFNGCTQLKYFHLPLLSGQDQDENTQASFYLGVDKEDVGSWYNEAFNLNFTKKGVFAETAAASTGAVLVGETAQFANNQGEYYNSSYSSIKALYSAGNNVYDNYDETKYKVYRYPTDYLPGQTTYYYVRGESEFEDDTLENVTGNAIKYWIHIGQQSDHKYLLFDSRDELKTYYGIV